MSDLFEEQQQTNIFEPRFPGWYSEEARQARNERARGRREFRERMQAGPGGAGLSVREYGTLYDLTEKGLADDDDVYKIVSAKQLGEYLGLPTDAALEFYDELWAAVSEDNQNRYVTAKSMATAIDHSVQIATNLEPMGRMGIELQALHAKIARAPEAEREPLQQQAGELWEKIAGIQKANEVLARGMPEDALSTIVTSTIQSAPLTGKSMLGGAAGALVLGVGGALVGAAAGGAGAGPGFVAGAKMGYKLGAFAASSAEMAGLMYVDLLAAGVERENAATLAVIGGSLQGFIEAGLGTVAGWGKSAVKAVGGKVLTQEAQKKIAEAASKNFIKKITTNGMAATVGKNVVLKTAVETAKQAGEEGLEEALQFLVDQMMLSLGEAMQDAPVDRNSWGSPEFWAEMEQSFWGGIAGGIGFGVMGLPLNYAGSKAETVRQTAQLQNLAVTIDDKAEFRAAAKLSPLTKYLSDEQIDQMHDSQEGERQAYHQAMREEAARAGEEYRLAAMPTLEAPGEMRRKPDGRLDVRIAHPENENGTGAAALWDPSEQRMGNIEFYWDIEENTVTIENIELSQAVTDREEVIGGMIKEIAFANPEMDIVFEPTERMNAKAGVDLAALKNKLIEENPRGADWKLQFYRKGDRFAQTRAMNEDIDLIASFRKVSREQASDIYEVWDTVCKNFGLDTHETIGRMGLTSEEDLRALAAENPEGVEAQIAGGLDQKRREIAFEEKIAAQKKGMVVGGGMVVIRPGENGGPSRILAGNEAMGEAFDLLRAVTVMTEDSNPSTLHHEWLHFMVKAVIPNSPRYRALLEEAVGKKMEDFTEGDHEWLAENYERYLHSGKAPTPGLKALFERIARALVNFVREGHVSPRLREFFDKMLAGPDAEIIGGENRQGQESRARVQADNEQQRAFAEMTSAERIAQSDLYTREEKAEILFATAEQTAIAPLDKRDRGHGPTAALIARAMRIPDAAERARAIAEIRELRKRYAGTEAEFKAPNGKATRLIDALGEELGKQAWYAARTENFKNWFGDWERAARIALFENSPNIDLDGDAYKGKYELNKDSILDYLENTLRKETMRNPAIDADIRIAGKGIKKLTNWGMRNDVYKKLFAHIPELTQKAIVLLEETPNKPDAHYNKYTHLACGIEIDGKPQTVHIILGENQGQWYYSHILLDIEKGSLLAGIRQSTPGHPMQASPIKKEASQPYIQQSKPGHPESASLSDIKDTTLLKLLQADSSKIVDGNGEPLPVFHGTDAEFDTFLLEKAGTKRDPGDLGKGFYFTTDKNAAALGNAKTMPVFINARNPLDLKMEAWEQDKAGTVTKALGLEGGQTSEGLRNKLLDNGNDAVVLDYAPLEYFQKELLVLNPEQIKSATGNAGTFDPNNPSILFQTGYHGSPYLFNSFDFRYLGKGAGAQLYGHGGYIASVRSVAERYVPKNTGKTEYYVDGQKADAGGTYRGIYENAAAGRLQESIQLWEDAKKKGGKAQAELAEAHLKEARKLEGKKVEKRNGSESGHLYEVDIPERHEMLDWDRPLSAQPEYVQKMLKQNRVKYDGSATGESLYNLIVKTKGSPAAASKYLNSIGIQGIRYLDNHTRNANYVVFEDKNINITKMLFQMAEENTKTDNFKNWFGDWENDPANASKAVDKDGKPLVVYHGTARPDRIGDKFDPKRATSGPMAFFTTDSKVGSNYATGKQDTSLAYDDLEPGQYENWFRVKVGRGKPVPITDAWYRLPIEQREKIKKLAPRVTEEDGEIYLADEGHTNGIGNYDYEIKKHRGNAAAALVGGWLNSGNLFNDEQRFYEVLKLAGFDNAAISYHDPNASYPAVYPVYLNIRNPMDTSNISPETISALKEASKTARMKKTADSDMWDKNNISPKEWIADLDKDIKDETTFSWTRIPDWVTKTLKTLGFDGIKDRGGKYSDLDHGVWVPFGPAQIKSVFNKGMFDPDNPSILFQLTRKEYTAEEKRIIEDAYGTMPEREVIEKAKADLGITADFDKGGYIMPDGEMLNTSAGKYTNLRLGRNTFIDHQEPAAFLLIGNIRIDTDYGGIELARMPTREQLTTLRKYIKHRYGNVGVDIAKADENFIDDAFGDDPFTRLGALYTETKADRILNDITAFFEKGTKGMFDPDNPSILFQTGYHGSPYRFERFDSSHIGSGEGAQTEGWGLYFASKREVAEYYHKALSNTTIEISDMDHTETERLRQIVEDSGLMEYISKKLREEGRNGDVYLHNVIDYIEETGERADIYGLFKTISSFVGSDKEARELFEKNDMRYDPGQLYEVDIPGDEDMITWDERWDEQPEKVRKILADALDAVYNNQPWEDIFERITNPVKVYEIYDKLSEKLGSPRAASLYLNSLGIKGIRYLDRESRARGEGTYNYVIFDDSDITITKMLFQMTRDQIQEEALRFKTWQDWMKAEVFAETQGWDAAYRRDDGSLEPQARQEIEAWYEKQWNEARVLAREAALWDDGIRTPANAEAVDTALLDEDTGGPDWDPELYEEEEYANTGERISERDGGPDRPDTGADEAAAGDTGGDGPDTVRQRSGDGTAGRAQNAGRREGRGDSGTEDGVTAPPGKPITTGKANRRLAAKLPQVIDGFLAVIGQTMRTNLAHYGAVTEEDAQTRDQIERDKERIYREAHPYVRGLALRASTGKSISDTQRRAAVSHMRRSLESGATVYRELYASLTEDSEFVSYAENEVRDTGVQGEAQRAAEEAAGLTAFERTRLAERIIDGDIARKIRSGKATQEEIEDYLKRRNEEIWELDAAVKQKEAELEQSKGETAEERAEADRWYRQYQKTRKELAAAVKEAKGLEKKLERAQQVRANAAERARAGRDKSEAKLKEKLAAKQNEIRALRGRLKDDVAHAKKQGRMETAWKWAEERRKLDRKEAERKRRIADRKAAAKYLEANRKLAAWIMSADRIGMNVWVRQRELLMGIQNALFGVGETADRALKLDAQIKKTEEKIDKEKKRLARAKGEDAKAAAQWQIEQHEALLENLKSERQYAEVIPPDLEGVKTGQQGDGADTVDTGTVMYNGRQVSVEEFRKEFYEHKIRYGFMDSRLRKALRRRAQPLSEKRKTSAAVLAKSLSQEDLLAIKAVMQQLNKEGRANWERRKFAEWFHQQEMTKTLLMEQDDLVEEGKTGEAKRYIKAMQASDTAERERLLAGGTDRQKLLFDSWDDKRLLQWMSGNQKGALYRFIIRDRLRYAHRRDAAIAARTDRILDFIGQGTPEQNLKESAKVRERAQQRIKELGEKNIVIEGVGPRNALRKWGLDDDFNSREESVLEASTSIQVSPADLMFMAVALDNKFAREHLLYGNLWSDDERAMYEPKDKDGKISPAEYAQIRDIGRQKENALRAAIDEHLFEDDGKGGRKAKGDLLRIVDAIRDDFETHFGETRAVYEEMFNMVVEGQDNYLPLIITEGKHSQAEKKDEVEALTQGSHQVRISPDRGMMHCRVDIGPTHQTAIETDIFKVFFKGVEREEHFAKFAPYVRDINTVLRGRNNGSKQLASKLSDVYGKWALKRLYQHVNMEGLPPSAKLGNAWENAADLGRLLAGHAGVAYIAYNVPAWLAQYPNSIAGFVGKADARFILAACLEVMKPGSDLVERVFEKSPKVMHRVIDVAQEYLEHMAGQTGKLKEAHAKFIEIGMAGQRHADKTMVAAGWWALYQTALNDGKSEEDAVVFADEITAETQPDLHPLETSPMYKEQGLGNLFLRFTQPLNMVWQNLTYDSFVSREKNFAGTAARITAYGLAALIVAAIRGGLAKKDDEDIDRDELVRRVFYYLVVSQFAESVPLIGNMASGFMERMITGEGTVYKDQYFELASRVLSGAERLGKEDFKGAVKDALYALGLGVGLPVSQANRMIKAGMEKDPWIIFGYNPQ